MYQSKLSLSFSILVCSLAAGLLFALSSRAAETNAVLRQRTEFIGKYCADCHDDVSAKSGLDLVQQSSDLGNPINFETWVKVHDKVEAGEMPPKKKARPEPDDLHAFVAGLKGGLSATEEVSIRENGRAMKRRINRYEYENTLRDLLSLPWIQIKDRLPEDGEKYRFNKVGEALDVSYVQLSRYMNSADYALRAAMSEQLEHPALVTNRYYARDNTDGQLLDNTHLEKIPGRKAPGEPIPTFELTVRGTNIAYIEFSAPRPGEYLVAEEVRFVRLPTAGK